MQRLFRIRFDFNELLFFRIWLLRLHELELESFAKSSSSFENDLGSMRPVASMMLGITF